jgi:hypothetical protein
MMPTDQPRLYADTIAPVYRNDAKELFLLTLEARPNPDSEGYGEVGGAFVNCWVNACDLRSAELRAIALIEDHGWRPQRFESWELVTRETYVERKPPEAEAPNLRELVDQAFVDGEVCVFNTWSIDAPDA